MNPVLPDEALEFGAAAARAFADIGGTDAARRAEDDPGVRGTDVAGALAALGAGDLDPRDGPDALAAAATLCEAAGRCALPYPVPGVLLSDGDGRPFAVVPDAAARVDHGDLFGEWRVARLGGAARAASGGRALGTRLGPFVADLDEGDPLPGDPGADVALHLALTACAVLGTADRAVELAVEHVTGRIQFGKPIATFQTVQFALADASVAVGGLRELAHFTLWRLVDAPDRALADVLALRLHALDVARAVLRTTQQLHGAAGVCDEYDISVLARMVQPALRLPWGAERTAAELAGAVGRLGFDGLSRARPDRRVTADPVTLGGFLDGVAARFGPNEALVGGDGVRWTYADLHAEADRVGRDLLARGVKPGEAVGILMGNRPEAVAAFFGAARVGAVAVLLSTFAPRPELAGMLDRARVTTVLTQERLLGRRFGDDLAALGRVAVLGAGSDDGDPGALRDRAGAVRPDDDALVIFSSGTTAAPKGMVHAHRGPVLQFHALAAVFGRHERTRMWSPLPLFWSAGLISALGATLAAGGCFVMQETFEAGEALRLLARERVTEPYCLPHQTGALAEHPDWAATDLSALTCVYGKGAFARHPSVTGDTGWMMPVGYGLSETCAFFTAHPSTTPRERMKASMGPPLPGNELRVVDPATGAPLRPGETGELAVRGPTLLRRYLGRAPGDTFDADGFLHTGDVGFVDGDGELHFEGRRTEMIRTAGANVSPAEIEVALRACPPVKLSRVVGIPDPRVEEVVVACVVLKRGAEASEDDIRSFLRERVAVYKVPRRVLFFADGEIPMTGSDAKVRDDALVGLVQARLR